MSQSKVWEGHGSCTDKKPLVQTGILVLLAHTELCFAPALFCCKIHWQSAASTDTTNDAEPPGPQWPPHVCLNSLQLLEREMRGICNKVSQFTCIRRSHGAYAGSYNHPQASQTCTDTINCVSALGRFRATAKRPFSPCSRGRTSPGEPPGRDESQGSGGAETFWCQERSLQIQLEQLKEVTAPWLFQWSRPGEQNKLWEHFQAMPVKPGL